MSFILFSFSFGLKLYFVKFFLAARNLLQVVVASKAWMLLSSALKPDPNQFSFTVLLNSRTNSTAPKYIKEIFFFFCGVLALYIFNLHSFTADDDPNNPLVTARCRSD